MGYLSRPLSPVLRILLVDRDEDSRGALRSALEARIGRPLEVTEAGAPPAAEALAGGGRFDALALDLETCGGVEPVAALIRAAGGAVGYALGPRAGVLDAVAAVRAGAADFIEKPVDGAAFARRIERQVAAPDDAVPGGGFEGMVGQSAAMRSMIEQIARIAPSPAPVFVFGEAGTGKSMAAAAVHARSRRRSGPFVTVDCADPAGGLAARLFGADGAVDRADGGTLHLDSVETLDDAAQAALLRLLDVGEVGGPGSTRRPQVRLVAASRLSPARLGAGGRIRPDLFFRLAVLPLAVPPLRDRTGDVVPLAESFLRAAARAAGARPPRLSPEAARALDRHRWPGNLHEMKAVAADLAARRPGAVVAAEDLRLDGPAGDGPGPVRPLREAEERLIEEAVRAFGGNVARAAAALEISPSTIYRKRRWRPQPAEAGVR